MQTLWFVAFVSTICLEGLGRKYLLQVPSAMFYFAKDVVLLAGLYLFRPTTALTAICSHLYRGFKLIWVVGFIWTAIEILNPSNQSYVLGVIGLRAYWLWWISPLVVASVLRDDRQKRRAIYVLLATATFVSILAALQFAAPADSAWNLYSVVDGEEVYANQVMVHTTGRPRVASSFSYISGFSAFTTLVPALLLSIGLDARDRNVRLFAFLVTCVSAAVVPMSGSRSSLVYGVVNLLITAWAAGLFVTRIGRRVMAGGIAAALMLVAVFPDAFLGVQSRFEDRQETNSRFALVAASVLPPIALATFDYPAFGIGTGMMQNARQSLQIRTERWEAEVEPARNLIELGPAGFLIVWTAKLGLLVALLRAYKILKKAGRRGASAAALSFSIMTLIGSLTYDHIWQALYFMGCGFILAEVASVVRATQLAAISGKATLQRPVYLSPSKVLSATEAAHLSGST